MVPVPTIRPAGPADAPAIHALLAALTPQVIERPEEAAPFLGTCTQEAVAARLADPAFTHHVAEVSGEVVGFVAVRDGSHLYHLFVADAYQGSGLGARLWDAARTAAGAPRFTVNATRNAVGFYQRQGFSPEGPLVRQHGLSFQPMALDAAASPNL
ncbi:MAG TPA: GNAT family N-acetyltransferase [Rubricoccaceae bacterium]|nr:GNAT family N-acetyltransferase [Rubricoccaceae bacterium]